MTNDGAPTIITTIALAHLASDVFIQPTLEAFKVFQDKSLAELKARLPDLLSSNMVIAQVQVAEQVLQDKDTITIAWQVKVEKKT